MGNRSDELAKAVSQSLERILYSNKAMEWNNNVSLSEFMPMREAAFEAFRQYMKFSNSQFDYPVMPSESPRIDRDTIDALESKFFELALPVMMDDQHILGGRLTYETNSLSHEKMWAMIGRSMTKRLFSKVHYRKKGRPKKLGGSDSLDRYRAMILMRVVRDLSKNFNHLHPIPNKEIIEFLLKYPHSKMADEEFVNIKRFKRMLGIDKGMTVRRLQNSFSNGKKFLSKSDARQTDK